MSTMILPPAPLSPAVLPSFRTASTTYLVAVAAPVLAQIARELGTVRPGKAA